MKRVVNKTHSFKDAEKWDIQQQINMTPQQRMEAAKQLKDRIWGKTTIDVREYHGRNKKN